MHAIMCNYDHLDFQRTQLYGNLFYNSVNINNRPEWEDYVISERERIKEKTFGEKILRKLNFLDSSKNSSKTHMRRVDQ